MWRQLDDFGGVSDAHEPLESAKKNERRGSLRKFASFVIPAIDSEDAAIRRASFSFLYLVTLIACATVVYYVVEGWELSAAFYFAVNTALTVGYGDIHPKKTIVFTSFYIWFAMAGTTAFGVFVIGKLYNDYTSWLEAREDHPLEKSKKTLLNRILFVAACYLTTVMVGTLWASWHAGWDLFTAFYFITISVSTTGIGDFTMKDPVGRVIIACYLFFAVMLVTFFLGSLVEYIIRIHSVTSVAGHTKKTLNKIVGVLDATNGTIVIPSVRPGLSSKQSSPAVMAGSDDEDEAERLTAGLPPLSATSFFSTSKLQKKELTFDDFSKLMLVKNGLVSKEEIQFLEKTYRDAARKSSGAAKLVETPHADGKDARPRRHSQLLVGGPQTEIISDAISAFGGAFKN